jgi:hypothetical protein
MWHSCGIRVAFEWHSCGIRVAFARQAIQADLRLAVEPPPTPAKQSTILHKQFNQNSDISCRPVSPPAARPPLSLFRSHLKQKMCQGCHVIVAGRPKNLMAGDQPNNWRATSPNIGGRPTQNLAGDQPKNRRATNPRNGGRPTQETAGAQPKNWQAGTNPRIGCRATSSRTGGRPTQEMAGTNPRNSQ